MHEPKRIGFISTRIYGSDGVSLEIEKWACVLEQLGYTCYYIAGLSDRPPDRTYIIPEAHFQHPVIEDINKEAFGKTRRSLELSKKIHEVTWIIKKKLHAILKKLNLDVIIAENCLTIPLNIPLGLALVETVMETDINCIAHHHDFVWERERFLINCVDDYLHTAFPPILNQIYHVAINSLAGQEFSRRTGLSCAIIPNVMDFDNPPPPMDDYAKGLRKDLGLKEDDVFILQPTRIVQRKGIEHSIELIKLLGPEKHKLVISHAYGDEGTDYFLRIKNYAALLGVDIIFAADIIQHKRGTTDDGRKIYSIWDAYQHADLVTYPSTYEGFGNAFLETIYFKKPILCNRYSIYRTDIEPCGFKTILIDGYLTDPVVEAVKQIIKDRNQAQQMADYNYNLAKKYFSYRRISNELKLIFNKMKFSSNNHKSYSNNNHKF